MYVKYEARSVFLVIKTLLLIGGVESNPGPKCKVISRSEAEKCTEDTVSHQNSNEVQCLRKRVNELETQVLAVNIQRVTELANQKHEYEQRLRQQRAGVLWHWEWMDAAGRLRALLPKDKLSLFVYFFLVAFIIFILLKTGHKHHGHGNHLFWGKGH